MPDTDCSHFDLLSQTKQICANNNIKPTRSRGQNFLINKEIYSDILEAASLEKTDIVLEIGPGLGFLTEKLASKVKKVIAIELDDKLAKVLTQRLKDLSIKNVTIINKNVLDISARDLKEDLGLVNYKIVANLPYNITSIFLRKFLSEVTLKPSSLTLMLQKEVVERICAKPSNMSILAISVQYYAKVQIIKNVPKEYFWPLPEVDSAIIRLDLKKQFTCHLKSKTCTKLALCSHQKEFFRLIKIGFAAKRKMLKNNLANGFHINTSKAEDCLIKAGLSNKARAQDLSLKDWEKLSIYTQLFH